MLLTSGQVSLAISSTIVFICTTTLFLCGYAVQQKTVNNIREAIKPQPRPVHTNLYIPPKPDPTPGVALPSEDNIQIVEVIEEGQSTENRVEDSTKESFGHQVTEAGEEEGLVQGADGGFLRKQTQRQRKQKALLNDMLEAELRRDDISQSRMSEDASGRSGERLSRAARRKLIKDEFVKLAGEDELNNAITYKRRRLW